MRTFAVVGLVLVAGLFGFGGLFDVLLATNVHQSNIGSMAIGIGITAALAAIGLWSIGRERTRGGQ